MDQQLYQVAVSMSAEEEPKPDDTCLWLDVPSDKLLYGAAALFSDEEGEEKLNAGKPAITTITTK